MGFPVLSVHGKGVIAAHAPPRLDCERVTQAALIEVVDRRRLTLVDLGRGLAKERGVRRGVITLVEPGVEPHIEVVQRGERAGHVEAALAERAPEALHLSVGRRVVGERVNQRRAQALAAEVQGVAAIGRAIMAGNAPTLRSFS